MNISEKRKNRAARRQIRLMRERQARMEQLVLEAKNKKPYVKKAPKYGPDHVHSRSGERARRVAQMIEGKLRPENGLTADVTAYAPVV